MLLSVVVYNHRMTPGQWVGSGVVFAGISVEAFVKRKGELHNCTLMLKFETHFRHSQMFMRNVSYRRRKGRKSNLCNIENH